MGREVGPVAQVAPAAHHGQVDAGTPALHLDGQDVGVSFAVRFHGLLVQHARQRRDLVAQLGRLLELQLSACAIMRASSVQHLLGVAAQESARRAARPARTASALIRPTQGPEQRLIWYSRQGRVRLAEHRVLAGAQPKHLLQQLDALLDRPGAGVGAEVAVLFVHRTPVVGHARVHLAWRASAPVASAGDLQVGVALVVAKQDVELGLLRLDEVVFEQQRLGLGAHHRGLQPHDLAHHVADARAAMVLVEVAGNPLLQVARLAHVQQRCPAHRNSGTRPAGRAARPPGPAVLRNATMPAR
jgi:hypothetical protein